MTFSQPCSGAHFGKAWAGFILHCSHLRACLSLSTLRLSLPRIGVELGLVPKTPKSLLLTGKLQESLLCVQPPASREACRVQSSPSRPAPSCPPSWALWMCPPRKCPSKSCSDHSEGVGGGVAGERTTGGLPISFYTKLFSNRLGAFMLFLCCFKCDNGPIWLLSRRPGMGHLINTGVASGCDMPEMFS